MRDAVTWVMLFVACLVVGILGYRYYQATQQIALLTRKAGQLTAEIEGVAEVHQLTEAKSAQEVQKAEGTIAKLTQTQDKLKAEAGNLRKELSKAGEERDQLKTQLAAAQNTSRKLQVNLQALEADKEQLQGEAKRLQAEIERRGRLLQQERDLLAGREKELHGITKAREADQEALRLWQETAQRLVEEQKKLKAQLDAREEELMQATLQQAERAAEIHLLTQTLKEREEHIAALRRRLAELEGRRGQQPTSSTSRSTVAGGH